MATASEPAATDHRLVEIDALRGLIMVLMALDHTRDFIMGLEPSPTDLATTTPALFATRWVTHICAPGFILLAGVSAFLLGQKRSAASLSSFLALRGAFLVVLEVTVVTFAWLPDPSRSLILLQVIWAIGWSMILLAGLIHLPRPAMAAVALGLLGMVAWADIQGFGIPAVPPSVAVFLLLGGETVPTGDQSALLVSYAVLPWAAVMALGYLLGPVFTRGEGARGRLLVRLGLGMIAAFLLLRATGVGDPVPWVAQDTATRTVMALLNAEKYPPSPVYLLMTLGPTLLLLAAFARIRTFAIARVLVPLGRAPLFFYVLHLYALRALGLALAAIVWGPGQLGPPPLHSTPEWGLGATWAIWIAALAVLFWPTRWFARLKARSRGAWTSYL
ncbi:MAG: heparan-alpha-glucosaminide N-acetyltransferase domain-containing protein [Pseudomonadota bacterium]